MSQLFKLFNTKKMKKTLIISFLAINFVILVSSCKTSEQQVVNDINKFCDIFHQLTISNDSLKAINLQLIQQNKALQQQLKEKIK